MRCPSCGSENLPAAAFCGMCKVPFRKAPVTQRSRPEPRSPGSVARPVQPQPAAGLSGSPGAVAAGVVEAVRRLARPVLKWALGGMPPGPRATGAPIFIWLPVGGIRLPERCPGCGGPPATDFEIDREEYLYLVLWLYTTRARVTARFCEPCAAAVRRRRLYLWLRAGIPFALIFVVMPILTSCREAAMYRDPGAGGGRFWVIATLLVVTGLLAEAGRWAFKAHARRFCLGLRIAAIGEGRICLETDDPEYATQVRTLNGAAAK